MDGDSGTRRGAGIMDVNWFVRRRLMIRDLDEFVALLLLLPYPLTDRPAARDLLYVVEWLTVGAVVVS
jgi:hypothetical protein